MVIEKFFLMKVMFFFCQTSIIYSIKYLIYFSSWGRDLLGLSALFYDVIMLLLKMANFPRADGNFH